MILYNEWNLILKIIQGMKKRGGWCGKLHIRIVLYLYDRNIDSEQQLNELFAAEFLKYKFVENYSPQFRLTKKAKRRNKNSPTFGSYDKQKVKEYLDIYGAMTYIQLRQAYKDRYGHECWIR